MQAGKRHIKNGHEYNHLFPKVNGEFITIKKHGFLNDTLNLMQRIFDETIEDTTQIAPLLKGKNVYETCYNVWSFTYNHLQYKLDEKGKEQVRRPARSWRDRKQGVDCDCMSVFIGSILLNLGIPFSLRLTKNKTEAFEHVYPVAHTKNGILILDAVIDQFNQEAPHTYKKDIRIMEVQYLNGLDNPAFSYDDNERFSVITSDDVDYLIENDYPMDAQELLMDNDLEGLRDFFKKAKQKVSNTAQKVKTKVQNITPEKIKAGIKKGANVINKINPVTGALRLGILASMKLNVMQVASKLRFAYWSDHYARSQRINLQKFYHLKRIRQKLESIFFTAGGKPENLRKAILEGKGNRDRRVQLHGLGSVILPIYDEDDLQTILGDELYHDEAYADQSVNGLGVVVTSTAIASASGVLATIAGLIKKLGSLFPKGSTNAEQEVVQENTEQAEEKRRKFSFKNLAETVKKVGQHFQTRPQATKAPTPVAPIQPTVPQPRYQAPQMDLDNDFPPLDDSPQVSTRQTTDDTSSEQKDEKPKDDTEKGIIPWIKANPIPTTLIGLGTAGITALIVYKVRKSKKQIKALNSYKKKPQSNNLSGVKKKPQAKKKKTTTRKPKTRSTPIKKVALL
jgi:hypothetical protein